MGDASGIELSLQVSDRRLLEYAFMTVTDIGHEDVDRIHLAG
jgi:hypothetical protein